MPLHSINPFNGETLEQLDATSTAGVEAALAAAELAAGLRDGSLDVVRDLFPDATADETDGLKLLLEQIRG